MAIRVFKDLASGTVPLNHAPNERVRAIQDTRKEGTRTENK
jgi:hypothetical protein